MAVEPNGGNREFKTLRSQSTAHQKKIKRQVVFALFVESFGIDPQAPLQLVVLAGRECGRLQDLTHLFTAEAEIADRPHVVELDDFDLGVTPETQME